MSMTISICNAYPSVKNYENASLINALHNVPMQNDLVDTDAEIILSWLNEILEHDDINVTTYAKRTDVSQSTLSRFMRRETSMLSNNILSKLALKSPVAVPRAVQKKLDLIPSQRQEQSMNFFAPASETGIPVWGIHPLRHSGEFHINAYVVNHLARLSVADRSLKLAAFYAPDDSMAPRWRAGEPVIFDLARPATAGDVAVIKLSPSDDPNADETYLFRQLAHRSNGVLHLRAFDDLAMPTSVPIDRVLEARRVLDWGDILE